MWSDEGVGRGRGGGEGAEGERGMSFTLSLTAVGGWGGGLRAGGGEGHRGRMAVGDGVGGVPPGVGLSQLPTNVVTITMYIFMYTYEEETVCTLPNLELCPCIFLKENGRLSDPPLDSGDPGPAGLGAPCALAGCGAAISMMAPILDYHDGLQQSCL